MKYLAEYLSGFIEGKRLVLIAVAWNALMIYLVIQVYYFLLDYPEVCAGVVAFFVVHRISTLWMNGEDPTVPDSHFKSVRWTISWLKSGWIKKIIPMDLYKWLRWHSRNPIHDFTHNVIGYKGFEHYTFNVIPNSEKTTQMDRWTLCFRWSGTFLWPCLGYESDNVKFYWGMHQRGVLQVIPRLTRNKNKN